MRIATDVGHSASGNYTYRTVTPLHGRHHSHSRYYGSEGMVSHRSSLGSFFEPTSRRQYNSDIRGSSSPTFIPTPSDMANSYSNYQPMVPRSPTASPSERYATTLPYPSPHTFGGHGGPLRPRVSTSRPRSGTLGSSGSTNSPSGERFPCEKCGKTFSRSHDRKRHHETQHLATPIIHRCRYCEKEFSRSVLFMPSLSQGSADSIAQGRFFEETH